MVRSDRHVHNLDRMAADRLPTAHAVETLAREVLAGKVVPRATYRVQLHAGFTFDDARAVVPYLSDLGISHVYASPFLQANPGSTHGYDVVDYNRLNPEIGDESSLDALVSALREHGMGLVVDFVPNHMGIGRGANPWWQDVLENGLSSVYSAFFDIDWEPLKPELQGQVLLPVLGDQYGVVLERGELHLVYRAGEFAVHYFQLPLPISPPGYPLILADVVTRVAERLTPENHDLLELQSVTTAFERLPGNDDIEPEHLAERQREQVVAKRRLASLVDRVPVIAEAVAQVVDTLNGVPGDPHSFDALDQLLAAQSYRLAFWKVAAEEINYRRFFAINELAAIRQEVPAVFEATHQYLLRLAGDGKIDGIRLDHPDGLWDPGGYFRQLQSAAFLARARAALGEPKDDEWQPWCEALHDWWEREPRGTVVYSLAEKILEPGETLPRNWAIDGTVGYEFARVVTGLFVDPKARKPLDELNHRLSGEEIDFSIVVYESKQLIMRAALASEVNVLARVLDRITERRRRTRDFTVNSLRRALREVIACFPIYRTYSSAADGNLTAEEQRAIETAVRAARRRSPESDPLVFDFLRDALLFRDFDGLDDVGREEQYRFVMKFQQLTGPVMAKGLEDTASYRYVRLTSLNEVGGDPARFGTTVAEFHDSNLLRLRDWPHAMLASSTHDTKRSEDVRARIDAITELPRDWRVAVNRWTRLNRRHKRRVDGSPAPDRADEYLLYQTLIGMWPLDRVEPDADLTDRIDAYMAKSIHEAQRHTSWINPNADYDGATSAFVRAVLDRTVNAAFLDDLAGFRTRIDRIGLVNALAQQLLKLTAPGMPDLYQGTELWDFNLVDPDNRRPVDFPTHRRALSALRRRSPSVRLARELLAQAADGRVKLWLTHRALMARRDHPDVFAGDYAALAASGSQAGHVIAFARHGADREALVLVPRLVGSLPASAGGWPVGEGVWESTVVPTASRSLTDVFTGERLIPRDGQIRVADALAELPVALLLDAHESEERS